MKGVERRGRIRRANETKEKKKNKLRVWVRKEHIAEGFFSFSLPWLLGLLFIAMEQWREGEELNRDEFLLLHGNSQGSVQLCDCGC